VSLLRSGNLFKFSPHIFKFKLSNLPHIFKFKLSNLPLLSSAIHPLHHGTLSYSSTFPTTDGNTYTSYLSSTGCLTVDSPTHFPSPHTRTYFTLNTTNTDDSLRETGLRVARSATLSFCGKGPPKNTYDGAFPITWAVAQKYIRRGPTFPLPLYPPHSHSNPLAPSPKIHRAGAPFPPPISHTFPLYQTSRRLRQKLATDPFGAHFLRGAKLHPPTPHSFF